MRRAVEPAAAHDDPDALTLEACTDVRRLRGRERLDPGVDRTQVDAVPHLLGRAQPVDADAQLGGPVGDRHPLRGRDQGLGRHDVGEHRGPAQTGTFDERDVRPEPAADERGLVPARPSSDDDDTGGLRIGRGGAHASHCAGCGDDSLGA
ncbi:hypothetical protein CSO01_27370 [Cellulomonas soli]|uniref:Uncharacterized protein n=1 Tax=Cellulomonas soli TaxID=931535 RepID=A0A512PFU7_9CELL|nr:hypothetical protein CSO01_27370 [Cellulomonas soli]